MLDEDVKTAIQAVADDWRATHKAGGDCTHYLLELTQILLPEINRAGVTRDNAMRLNIAAGNYANGTDPDTFTKMLAEL